MEKKEEGRGRKLKKNGGESEREREEKGKTGKAGVTTRGAGSAVDIQAAGGVCTAARRGEPAQLPGTRLHRHSSHGSGRPDMR